MAEPKKLTQEEADRLIDMLKTSLVETIDFPEKGKFVEFDLAGRDIKKDIFTAKIYRGKINRYKYDIGARIKKDGILLLELHIGDGLVHMNPDGVKLTGSHWHIYTEEYDRRMAVPADDVNSSEFIENTVLLLKRFHVIEEPTIHFQLELV